MKSSLVGVKSQLTRQSVPHNLLSTEAALVGSVAASIVMTVSGASKNVTILSCAPQAPAPFDPPSFAPHPVTASPKLTISFAS